MHKKTLSVVVHVCESTMTTNILISQMALSKQAQDKSVGTSVYDVVLNLE